jgi:cytochrome oxidase assembly protein ShyY1
MSGLLRQRPSAFAIGLTLVGAALFVRLGFWQLERARQAQRLLDAFAAAASAPVEAFASVAAAPPEQRYPHVRVHGRFVDGRSYLRDEQLRNERLGVEAYGVFAVDGQSALLLVDRGWRAWAHASGSAPDVPPSPKGDVELTGTYAPFPGNGLRVGGNRLATQSTWPKLTLAIDRDEIAADLKQPLLPRVLLLDADAASGFERQWTPAVMPPARHEAYAFQWFAFALAALVLFVVRHRRKSA